MAKTRKGNLRRPKGQENGAVGAAALDARCAQDPTEKPACADDIPTTSAGFVTVNPYTFAKSPTKKGIGKKSKKRLLSQQMVPLNQALTDSLSKLVNKSLRSKRRRSVKRLQNMGPRQMKSLKTKNNAKLSKSEKTKYNITATLKTTTAATIAATTIQKQDNQAAVTLEEGEILSELEDEAQLECKESKKDMQRRNNTNRSEVNGVDDNDDCVCLEPDVELITIEDETEEPTTLMNISNVKRNKNTKLASTPYSKFKSMAIAKHSTPAQKREAQKREKTVDGDVIDITENIKSDEAEEERPLFFIDTEKTLENIASIDTFTNYTNRLTLGDDRPDTRRRSRRLRGDRVEERSDDVIVIEDVRIPIKKLKNSYTDDSVIFISESNPNQCPAFIPLEADDVPNPINVVSKPKTPPAKIQRNSLFTKSEKKELNKYNENAYNPDSGATKPTTGKRMVIIDGCNVAFCHSLSRDFSVKGLKICLQYFEKMGHEVKAVVPQFRINKYKSSDPDELNALHRDGKLVLTPCKNLPGGKSSSYDDRFILQLACELDAAIVSNDNYRDLINENAAFKKIINNRVIGYTWCNDIFILPKDPYGKWGPHLHTILNRS